MERSTQIGCLVLALAVLAMAGCELDSFFDPSVTGRYEFTPTTIPILERIDVIEREADPWAKATPVEPRDLLPSDLTYRIAPGDAVTVEVTELVRPGEVWRATRRISAAGTFRLPPPIGDVVAAGFTAQEFQDALKQLIHEQVMPDPLVNVVIEEGAGFTFTIYGAIVGTGVYTLRSADFRLLDALSLAGGVPLAIKKVYVIRQVSLSPEETEFRPALQRGSAPARGDGQPVDIEDLIRRLEGPQKPSQLEEQPVDIDELIRQLEEPETPDQTPDDAGGEAEPNFGMFQPQEGPLIDIDELEPVKPPAAAPPAVPPAPAPVIARPRVPAGRYVYDEARDEWIPVEPEAVTAAPQEAETPESAMYVERIIEIPYQRLKQGDSSYNIVVRPDDRIYVREPESGVVYIDGEVVRPGVYSLPPYGLTLSRLFAAAGGPTPIAIPSRVDLTRIVGENREATIRVNLAAIRQKTEPDIYLKGSDLIIIGTNFLATPLAVFRNGLRMTYGYGFLLDRNFGNDVFGAPPSNIGNSNQ